jgi:peptidoglycan-associated lipoprotein
MNFLKLSCLGFLLAGIMLGYGCNSDEELEGGDAIPYPADAPITDMTDTGVWTEPGNELSAADKDGWVPMDNVKLPTIYFAYDQDRIGSSERTKLEKVAEYLQKNPGVCVIIEGHCDERGSEEYNRALGERRAIAIKDYLAQLGIPDTRMKTISYGEERPAVEGSTISVFAKNRRGELIAAKPGK